MEDQIEEIKKFTRFYGDRMIHWERALMGKGFSVREIKTILEIREAKITNVKELAQKLNTGKGQMSRLIDRLRELQLVHVRTADDDRRFSEITLTEKGTLQAGGLLQLYENEIGAELAKFGKTQREELVASLRAVKKIYAAG